MYCLYCGKPLGAPNEPARRRHENGRAICHPCFIRLMTGRGGVLLNLPVLRTIQETEAVFDEAAERNGPA